MIFDRIRQLVTGGPLSSSIVEVKRTTAGNWFWHAVGANHEIICHSQPFTFKKDAVKAGKNMAARARWKIVVEAGVLAVLLCGIAFASGTPAPVTYSALFGQNVPGQPGWTNTFQLNALPVGYGCTSVTVTLDQVSWTRNYAVSNRTETDETVTFDLDPSWVGFVLRGPDGNVYASHIDPVPAYDLFAPALTRVQGTQSANPYAHSATFTFGVPAGSFESATAPLPQQVWTMQFIEHFERPTTELPYNTRTSEWAHALVTFNH